MAPPFARKAPANDTLVDVDGNVRLISTGGHPYRPVQWGRWTRHFTVCFAFGAAMIWTLYATFRVAVPFIYDLEVKNTTWVNPAGDVRFDTLERLRIPQQVFVSVGSVALRTVVVSWVTFEPASAHIDSSVRIQNRTFTGRPATFTDAILCPGLTRLMHHVEVKSDQVDLTRATNYTVGYRSFRAMDELHFPPSYYRRVAVAGDVEPLRVALFADLGSLSYRKKNEMSLSTYSNASSIPLMTELVRNRSLDLFVHGGDIAYNLDQDCGRIGDAFMLDIEDIASRVPYMFGPGNHEASRWAFGAYDHYVSRYWGQIVAGDACGSHSTRYYSFDEGIVHFVMLDASAWAHPVRYMFAHHSAERQMKWLYDDLSRVDREATPWVVLLVHRALYCTLNEGFNKPECGDEAEALRVGGGALTSPPGLEPALLEFGVDLVISGHTHHYERTYPVAHRSVRNLHYNNPDGVVHVQSGIAGGLSHDAWGVPQTEWEAFRDESLRRGFLHSTFHNTTHADFKQLSDKGEVVDAFTIVQERHGRGFRFPA